MITPDIIEIHSDQPGPTLAIFAGVHGNETAGVFALQQMLPTLTLNRGTLLMAFANPPAIEANARMIGKNLNRCFYKGNTEISPEDDRARELMKVMDRADALLDLHMFYDDDGLPFVICEDNALDLVRTFDVDIISTNWTKVEPGGSDGYMFLQGKVGVCVECGPITKAKEYTVFATKTVHRFLQYYAMVNSSVAYSEKPKRLIRANRAVYKHSDTFRLADGLRNFDKLAAGQIVAQEGDTTHTANTDECIIFPHYAARIGEEAYIIGDEIQTSKG